MNIEKLIWLRMNEISEEAKLARELPNTHHDLMVAYGELENLILKIQELKG